jgi:hypothetical protein
MAGGEREGRHKTGKPTTDHGDTDCISHASTQRQLAQVLHGFTPLAHWRQRH